MKGSYALIIRLNRAKRLTVGRLGEFYFPAGHYIYLGSALNGLESRVRRHLRRDKKLHWHIDFLTAVSGICQVWWVGRWSASGVPMGAEGFGKRGNGDSAGLRLLRLPLPNPPALRGGLAGGGTVATGAYGRAARRLSPGYLYAIGNGKPPKLQALGRIMSF